MKYFISLLCLCAILFSQASDKRPKREGKTTRVKTVPRTKSKPAKVRSSRPEKRPKRSLKRPSVNRKEKSSSTRSRINRPSVNRKSKSDNSRRGFNSPSVNQRNKNTQAKKSGSESGRRGRLGRVKDAITTKRDIKRQNEAEGIGKGSTAGYFYYVDPFYRNRYYRNYNYYDPYDPFYSDFTDVIYVIDGRYPPSLYADDEYEEEPFRQYYSDYPYAEKDYFNRDSGNPMMSVFNIQNGNGKDDISMRSYQLQMAYQFLTLNIRHHKLSETINGFTDHFTFLQIAPGFSYGIDQWNSLLHFYLGAGQLTLESNFDDFKQTFGGMTIGLEMKSYLPYQFSAGLSFNYFGLKDQSEDLENLFSVLMTDINATYHIYRFGLKGGLKIQTFGGLVEEFTLRQPYVGLEVYF